MSTTHTYKYDPLELERRDEEYLRTLEAELRVTHVETRIEPPQVMAVEFRFVAPEVRS